MTTPTPPTTRVHRSLVGRKYTQTKTAEDCVHAVVQWGLPPYETVTTTTVEARHQLEADLTSRDVPTAPLHVLSSLPCPSRLPPNESRGSDWERSTAGWCKGLTEKREKAVRADDDISDFQRAWQAIGKHIWSRSRFRL